MATHVKRGKSLKKNNPVVHEMTFVSPDRNRKDAGMLKAAIQAAESIFIPNRYRLYDIYHDMITIDGHLSGLIEKRINAVLNKNLKYSDSRGKKVDAFDDLIYSEKFSDLQKLIVESELWGVSAAEFIIGEEFDFIEVPRKHIRP
jgi:hypothetical protein